MRGWKRVFILTLFIVFIQISFSHGDGFELNTVLMRSTFKIAGKDIAGKDTIGTVFIIGKPVSGDSKESYYILVTAAHVLSQMKEDIVTLVLRKNQGANQFSKHGWPLPIRNQGMPLWKEHPKADIAVMYVTLPREADIQMLPMSFLITDKQLLEFELHPGDNLSCLGYPYGAEANEAGFPILRSGQIASYPLTPTDKAKTFLYDFRVFRGNSGGPVYFIDRNRSYGGATRVGETI